MSEPKWFVFYTKSRHEKKVEELLIRRGYIVFLPMQKTMRQWSDRKKMVETPLFNSYIFVKIQDHQISEVVQIPGVAWNIRHNGKPAVLHPKEFELISRFLASGLLLEVTYNQELSIGDQVEIMDGPMKGLQGQLLRTASGNRFLVSFDSFGASIQIEIDPIVLKKL